MTSPAHQFSGPVVYGRIDESLHQVAAAVVEEVLLRLGREVVVESPHPQMYPQLAAGEQHLFADAWLPGGHEVCWEQVRDSVVEVTALYGGAAFHWVVPAPRSGRS